jgi:hypothetical protein
VTRCIIPETVCLEKPQSLIPNQLNVEGFTWKKNINYTKEPKQKMKIEIIGIKIKIQNKIYF